jgi:hypothetical protein
MFKLSHLILSQRRLGRSRAAFWRRLQWINLRRGLIAQSLLARQFPESYLTGYMADLKAGDNLRDVELQSTKAKRNHQRR